MSVLQAVAVRHLNETLDVLLFCILAPGELAGLLITGGHGGTRAEEAIALILGVVVNTAVWSTVLIFIQWLFANWCHLPARAPLPKRTYNSQTSWGQFCCTFMEQEYAWILIRLERCSDPVVLKLVR